MPRNSYTQQEYIGRINNVLQFIDKNIDKDIQLADCARVALFSNFHFHRIFSAYTGETLNAYIIRKRIEKVASVLMKESDFTFSDLAFKYGFNSASNLSRTFKKYYGISPTEFVSQRGNTFSKICKVDSKNGKAELVFEEYICNINNIKNWLQMNAKIEIKQMPELNLAYVKHVGQFDQIGQAYEKLMRWAGPKGLLGGPNFNTVTVYHDDPQVTEISKVRQSAALTINDDVKVDGEVGKMKVDAGKFAVGRFEIGVMEFKNAWDSMCVWVEENGYTATDGDYYELYHNDHTQHPEQKFILDICIPVR